MDTTLILQAIPHSPTSKTAALTVPPRTMLLSSIGSPMGTASGVTGATARAPMLGGRDVSIAIMT